MAADTAADSSRRARLDGLFPEMLTSGAMDLTPEQEVLLMEALACSWEDAPPDFAAVQAQEEVRHTGMDEVYLSTLPVSGWLGNNDGSKEECPLCLCEYELDEPVMRLPCLHSAHEECMAKWLARNRQCPECKIDVQECVSAIFND